MHNNIVSLRDRALADRLRANVVVFRAAQQVNYVDLMVEIGTLLLEAREVECGGSNGRFGEWLAANGVELSKDERSACMKLARDSTATAIARVDFAHCTSADWVWRHVKSSSEDSENDIDAAEEAQMPECTLESPVLPPQGTDQKDSLTSPTSEPEPLPAVSTRNAVTKWGDVGTQLFAYFSNPFTRSTWNSLVVRRHGRAVAEFAIAQLEASGIPKPVPMQLDEPNARLVLPWLVSPFAREYLLSTPSGFEHLKRDLPDIIEACRPIFADGKRFDKGNNCRAAFQRLRHDRKRQAQIAQNAALRESERKAVNAENHPPIVVHGVELWPDGHLPENLRLSYDAARFAFFLWREWDVALSGATGLKDVKQRASFWQQRQRAFHGLEFAEGAALSQFWWRAGQAMAANPDAESRCQLIVRVVSGR